MSARKLIIGCGYLGRRVARRWLGRGETVFTLTRTPERAALLKAGGFVPLVGDVTRPATLKELPPVDAVLYAVGFDRSSGQSLREVYVGGLGHLLGGLAGRANRFLYVSSTSVYGQNAGETVDESSACEPQSENGQVCLAAEQLLQDTLPSAEILRLAGLYGPGRLVARLAALRRGEPFEGNPDAWLNLIHVDDAVAAILACTERAAPGSTWLVSDDRPVRRGEYYSLLSWLAGTPPPQFLATQAVPAGREGLGKRCCNRRMRDELQVSLLHPTIATGLPAALVEPDR